MASRIATVKTLVPACGLATNFHSITHPSLPNYIAVTSGLPPTALGRFHRDCNAVPGCRTPAPSIFAQVPSWRAYEESMPGPCHRWFYGRYAASHNPPVSCRKLAGCAELDVQYGREMLGIPALLGKARTARSMRDAFNL